MNRRDFLDALARITGGAVLSGVTPCAGGLDIAPEQPVRSPNIVFFLVDDLGWGDFGCYGNHFHETPHIDAFAAEAMKFTRAYASAPVCSPSRAAILTGQEPARLQLTQWIPGVQYPHKKLSEPPTPSHLPKNVTTMAQQLKGLGYRTASIGKWHLGAEGFLPEDFGFDVNIAGDSEGHPPPPSGYFGPWHFHNLTGYTKDDYLTEVLTRKMDEFLDQAAGKQPFFLYMAEYAVHLPLQEREALVEKYRRKNGGKDQPDPVYAAMVESVDTAFGDLRSKLKTLGIAQNTVIVLTSDNGGVGFQGRNLHRIGDNGPLRAGKGFLYEGGVREPLIVSWPGQTRPGSMCDVPVAGIDFLPTVLSVLSAPAPTQGDGRAFTGLLRGEMTMDRPCLFWHYPHYSDQGGTPSGAVLEGDWKLIEFFEDGHLELYNLAQDPGELYNFASSFADRADDLRAKLAAWRERVGALMPTPNPSYNPALANLHTGPAGCSWLPADHCIVD